ncbi:5070_t:CDS:2 [Ambispora leptoticha]|uniref:5070_t:CDS:1 n=1 Tax=Ambispora leptoticha TaxID=144679 RepID=A0A9N8YQK6_9GLOM|nr:5070_t:CDS:2 [Ambispora leptoticha]
MLTLYDYSLSGNCYKVRLLLSMLRVPYVRVDVDIKKGESRTDEFLNNVSLNGKVPTMVIPYGYEHLKKKTPNDASIDLNATNNSSNIYTESKNGDDDDDNNQSTILSESNAILIYLSQNTSLLPSNPIEHAQVMQWLFWEQYSHEPNIATLRWWISYLDKSQEPEYLDRIVEKQRNGYEALNLMEKHLESRKFLVTDRFTIADVALYAYTHCAEEGNFPKIKAWLKRVEEQPGYIPIND